MLPVVEQLRAPGEVLTAFVRLRKVLVHERDDDIEKVTKAPDGERRFVVEMLLSPRVGVHVAHTEEGG
jgi:hypothetical protein